MKECQRMEKKERLAIAIALKEFHRIVHTARIFFQERSCKEHDLGYFLTHCSNNIVY